MRHMRLSPATAGWLCALVLVCALFTLSHALADDAMGGAGASRELREGARQLSANGPPAAGVSVAYSAEEGYKGQEGQVRVAKPACVLRSWSGGGGGG